MNTESNISIIMPVHNALFFTKKAIIELTTQISDHKLNKQITVVVVDDGSLDGTSEWISSNYPEIFIKHGDGNLWWSGSVNLGVKFALSELKVDYVLLWNNDCTTTTDYFQNLLQNITKLGNNKIIIASKVYYQDKPNVIFNMGATINKATGKTTLIGKDKIDSSEYEKEIEVDWTGGMGVLIHKEVFNQIGYFDENDFPHYYGDCDFYLRAKEKGFSIVVYPNLKVWNDREYTAKNTIESFRDAFHELSMIKSRYNLLIDYKFYKRHINMPFGYFHLAMKYSKFFVRILKSNFKMFHYR
ncbi:MAG: glycosyltransferase family 2 protein [Ignavibacteriales bacterium]|nr:glycosyltransferase family 2 protein [Ignavibacteriales bacterium]